MLSCDSEPIKVREAVYRVQNPLTWNKPRGRFSCEGWGSSLEHIGCSGIFGSQVSNVWQPPAVLEFGEIFGILSNKDAKVHMRWQDIIDIYVSPRTSRTVLQLPLTSNIARRVVSIICSRSS